ncbi:hypothetical protein QFC21_006603 [Naganishia friedmannii]|uniref:Uncharacterized protein n=1 Tax=Naganishia friedmannii TaxID=89922 RepID=A0ACC2V2K6_9TREE|nr:hypothetical protein QFC21_006603 [Naganishia friedmannii]
MLHHLLPRNENHSVSAEIHLQHELILVQPACHSSDVTTSDLPGDTLLNGVVIITSHPGIALWTIRIAFVVQYHYRLPGTSQWQEGIIYEHAKTFSHGGGLMGPSYNKPQDLIRRQLDIAILIPRDSPTYEFLANAKVIPQIKVDVEFGHSTWSSSALAALPPSPPVYSEQEEQGKTIAGRHFQTETWSGATVHPPSLSRHTKAVSTNTSPFTGCPFPHLKQTWIKEFAIASNPTTNGCLQALRFTREGVAAGIGAWKLYLWSDSFSVGSYLVPRFECRNASPLCNIYSIQLAISQQYSLKPIDAFFANKEPELEHQYPYEPHLIHSEGHRPPTDHPSNSDPAMWRGSVNRSAWDPTAPDLLSGDAYTWEAGKVRLPDDATIRPSTRIGTRTPVHISHKITLKVMFSVIGQTSAEQLLPGHEKSGNLRMLLIDLYEPVPSCTCVREWISLPGYEESLDTTSDPKVPFCACCYRLEDFSVATFTQAFPPEEALSCRETLQAEGELSTIHKSRASYGTRV